MSKVPLYYFSEALTSAEPPRHRQVSTGSYLDVRDVDASLDPAYRPTAQEYLADKKPPPP